MPADLGLLSAMITPAVLISASGTLIFSTATRLGRNVDRVRALRREYESLTDDESGGGAERRAHVETQLQTHALRTRLIQRSLTSFYLAVGFFVATTMAIAITVLAPRLAWLPTSLGVVGTIILFYGSVLLVGETRLALRSVDEEMEYVVRIRPRPGPH